MTPSWPYDNGDDSQVVRMKREEKFLSWVGRREKLIRIAVEVEKALVTAYKDLLIERDLHPETNAVDQRKAHELAMLLQPAVTVIAGKGRIRRSGKLEAILNDMDAREIEAITMGNGSAYSSPGMNPEIYIQIGDDRPGIFFLSDRNVRLTVSGADRQWVGGVFDNLAGELRKDVPWWAALRSTFAGIVIGALVFGGAGQWLLSLQPTPSGTEGSTLLLVLARVVMILFGVMLGWVALSPALRRVFPAVEVLEAGASPRGRQALAFVVGLLSLALGAAGVVLSVLSMRQK